MKRMTGRLAVLGVWAAGVMAAVPATALDEVSFGTNWLAQAEHGGFYQAVVDGIYEEYGLDVTIRQGGPNAANRSLLVAGQIDFYMGGNMFAPFDAVREGIPTVAVAAIFQKEPQVLMTHPDQGMETLEDLAGLPTLFISKDGYLTYFQWLQSAFEGFREEQYRPYAFNPAPFIADPQSAQQGYVTSEPFAVEREAGWTPDVFLLDDYGFSSYSTLIETDRALIEEDADLVQRFVDASIIGWYTYLYGDNDAANERIKQDNPEMTDAQIAYSIAKMKEYGIVDSGDALEQGIGCMTEAHHREFFDEMVAAGIVEDDIDHTRAYTTEFVCRGVGLEVKERLAAQ